MQRQGVDACYRVVLFPLLGGTVAARRNQPMQDSEQHSSFDGELKLAIPQQIRQYLADSTLLPEAFEGERWADMRSSGDALAVSLCA
jgi:hypothetical protein